MGWTDPRTWATTELVTASMLNAHLRDNLLFLHKPPRVQVIRNTTQSLTNGTAAPISWSSEWTAGASGMWTIGSPAVITAPVAGDYAVWTYVEFASNATGYRRVEILLGGAQTGIMITIPAVSGVPTYVVLGEITVPDVEAGNTLGIAALQNSGSSLNVVSARLSARWTRATG